MDGRNMTETMSFLMLVSVKRLKQQHQKQRKNTRFHPVHLFASLQKYSPIADERPKNNSWRMGCMMLLGHLNHLILCISFVRAVPNWPNWPSSEKMLPRGGSARSRFWRLDLDPRVWTKHNGATTIKITIFWTYFEHYLNHVTFRDYRLEKPPIELSDSIFHHKLHLELPKSPNFSILWSRPLETPEFPRWRRAELVAETGSSQSGSVCGAERAPCHRAAVTRKRPKANISGAAQDRDGESRPIHRWDEPRTWNCR